MSILSLHPYPHSFDQLVQTNLDCNPIRRDQCIHTFGTILTTVRNRDNLIGMLKKDIAEGTDRPCITGTILKDPEARLDDRRSIPMLFGLALPPSCPQRPTTDQRYVGEILSIGLSMVSAGLDTVPGNLIMTIAYLSSEHGQEIQQRALKEINELYPDGDGWERCLVEEKCSYITALVKETLRFWSVIPICLPRVSVKDVKWGNATIPAGTKFYMNAYGAHYDESHFESPHEFNPERYLEDKSIDDAAASRGTPHYGYGAGSRMCIGSHLANRELYTAFLRMILAFHIVAPQNPADAPILNAFGCNKRLTSLTLDPKPFKIGFRVRDREALERWIADSEERTKDL